MATINKSLTTYLPTQSVEWLERYCLDYKHLQNKDGNPKLGTAVADIIARLADGELVIPEKIEPQSTSPLQYGTELETLREEVDELKKLFAEYGTNKLPDTVLDLETVKNEIEVELEPIKESVSELETYTRSQLAAVRDELRVISDRAVEIPVSIASARTPARKDKPSADSNRKTWVKFFEMVGIEALKATEAQGEKNNDIRTKQIEQGLQAAREQGLGEWRVGTAGRDFFRVESVTPESTLPLFQTND